MTRSIEEPSSPLVVLIEAERSRHHHADVVSAAGFDVVSIPDHEASVGRVVDQAPSVVAAELSPSHPARTWQFVRQFRLHPQGRLIPCVVYGQQMEADDIETAARAGALWLQLQPSDGARLIAAVRGLVSAGRKEPFR